VRGFETACSNPQAAIDELLICASLMILSERFLAYLSKKKIDVCGVLLWR